MAIYRQLDEAYAAEERKGSLKAGDHRMWAQTVGNMGGIALASHQLESAESMFLRALAWPGVSAGDRVIALEGIAAYHKERKEWVNMVKCCEKALTLVPDAKKEADVLPDPMRDNPHLAPPRGRRGGTKNMRWALGFDERAEKIFSETRQPSHPL